MHLPGSKSVLEVAVALKTSQRRVLQLINEKQLRARNVSQGTKRPRWCILDEDLEAFRRGSEVPQVVAKVRRFV